MGRPGVTAFDLTGLLAIGFWVFFVVRLIAQDADPDTEVRLAVSPAELAAGFRPGEEWRGLYHGGDKVGFIRLTRERLDSGYAIELWQVLRLDMLGQEQRVDLRVRTEANDDFALRAFDGELESGGARFAVRGTVEPNPGAGGGYHIAYALTTPESTQHGQLNMPEPPQIEQDLGRALLARNPEPGDSFSVDVFDPLSQAPRTVVVEYRGREPIRVMGEQVEAHRLVQRVGGQALSLWVNEVGEVLREELPLGLVGQRESRAEAMYGVVRRPDSADAVDLIEAASIRVAAPVPDLVAAPRMRWRLTGIDAARFDLLGGRQSRLEPGPEGGGLDLLIVVEPSDNDLAVADLRLDREPAGYLLAEPLVQSDAEPIKAAAQAIADGETRVTALAQAVNDWVHANLDQEGVVSLPSALDVLATRRGDCNEHAVLATALLRALGVPARMAAGLAYLDGAFYYHAWVEYWHDGWRTMDPTWGQLPADLGHIRLVAGGIHRQIELVELFRRIDVEPLP